MIEEKDPTSCQNIYDKGSNKNILKLTSQFDYLKNFKGKFINSANGHPLAGLVVEVYYNEPSGQEDKLLSNSKEGFIGKGISDENGNFKILLEETRLVRQYLWLLDGFVDTFITLNIKDKKGKLYLSVKSHSGSNSIPTTIYIDLPEVSISKSTWAEFARRLERTKIIRLHEIARQLVLVSDSQSIFSDWDLETRHTIINDIERSYLDSKGLLKNQKISLTFYSLRSPDNLKLIHDLLKKRLSDHEVEIEKARIINNSRKVGNIFAVSDSLDTDKLKGDNYELVLVYGKENELLPESPSLERNPNDLLMYRDYLRNIYTGPITSSIYLKNLNRLKNRFHQDFETSKADLEAANEVLIPILKDILITPNAQIWGSDGFLSGFGIDPNLIKPRVAQSNRAYLDYLISFSGLSANELGLRYRLNLERPDAAISSPIDENIATLQDFYRDGFQDFKEFANQQGSHFVVPAKLRGKAPFFLHYDEWLQKIKPFFGENYYLIKKTFNIDKSQIDIKEIKDHKNPGDHFLSQLIDAEQNLLEGNKNFNRGSYKNAIENYSTSYTSAIIALRMVSNLSPGYLMNYVIEQTDISSLNDLIKLQNHFDINHSEVTFIRDRSMIELLEQKNSPYTIHIFFSIFHLVYCVLPLCLGDCATAMGDFPGAMLHYSKLTRLAVARANSDDYVGYIGYYGSYGTPSYELNIFELFESPNKDPYIYNNGSLPYSFAIADSGVKWDDLFELQFQNYMPPIEKQFFRIRHGDTILEWADTLYRTDEPSNIARARELYKSILYLHGEELPTNPNWDNSMVTNYRVNPVIEAQKTRANKALYQIKLNLNYYGENDEIVPTLRYKTLKQAADSFAYRAKLAQTDFMSYMGNLEIAAEKALRDGITYSNVLEKANLHSKIAAEQVKIAECNVEQAEKQVAIIEAAIEAKRQVIEEKDTFWGQVKDYFGEMKESITSLSSIGAGAEAAVSDMVPIIGFYYHGYKAIASMAEERNRLDRELKDLENETVPAAKMLVNIRNRDLNISNLNKDIAQADIELATNLLTALRNFEENRFLNIEMWAELSRVMKRIMQRYLDMSTRYAWLAERALSFDQDRSINIIKLDYFYSASQGILGSDRLLLDLAELDTQYLNGLKKTIPIKHTYSLSFDFPLAFAQLKESGSCTFQINEKPFQNAYPGFYSYRVRSITTAIQTLSKNSQVQGILRNSGVSNVSRSDGKIRRLVRESEASAISDFSLKEDMAVYGLPDECLFAFEGSGLETQWTLELPLISNLYSLNDIADIVITLDLRAFYSPDLYMKHIAESPKSIRRMILISSSKQQPKALEQLKSNQESVSIKFDMKSVGLSSRERKRIIKNLMVLIPAKELISGKAVLYPMRINYNEFPHFEFKNGLAISDKNSKLSSSIGMDLPQFFELKIEKAVNPNTDFSSIIDVILGVEYEGIFEES